MINKRRYMEVPYGNGDTLHKVVIESNVCTGAEAMRYVQNELFKQFHLHPDLMCCGPFTFETMSMRYDGEKWIVTLQSIEKNKES